MLIDSVRRWVTTLFNSQNLSSSFYEGKEVTILFRQMLPLNAIWYFDIRNLLLSRSIIFFAMELQWGALFKKWHGKLELASPLTRNFWSNDVLSNDTKQAKISHANCPHAGFVHSDWLEKIEQPIGVLKNYRSINLYQNVLFDHANSNFWLVDSIS